MPPLCVSRIEQAWTFAASGRQKQTPCHVRVRISFFLSLRDSAKRQGLTSIAVLAGHVDDLPAIVAAVGQPWQRGHSARVRLGRRSGA